MGPYVKYAENNKKTVHYFQHWCELEPRYPTQVLMLPDTYPRLGAYYKPNTTDMG